MTTTRPGPGKEQIPVKVDWLNVVLPIDVLEGLRLLLVPTLGPPEHSDRGMRFFPDGSYKWASGAVLAWNDTARTCWLSLNGDSLDLLGAGSWRTWLGELLELGGHVTRLDLAADVPRSLVSMDQVHAAAAAGDFCGFRNVDPRRPEKMLRGRMVRTGDQVNFGTRGGNGSGRFMRVYDKGLESKGEIDAVRFECEYSGEVAHLVSECLASSPTDDRFRDKVGRSLAAAIDFRHRNGHRHIARMHRVDWWARLVDLLGETVRLVASQPQKPLAAALEWFARSVAPTLALARIVAQSQGWHFQHFMGQLLDLAEQRIRWGAGAGKLHLGYDRDTVLSAARC